MIDIQHEANSSDTKFNSDEYGHLDVKLEGIRN